MIPSAFLLVAVIVNLAGCITGNRPLAVAVKPALLPLIALTSLAILVREPFDWRSVGLLIAAQLFGMAGDIFLISDETILFGAGMAAFLAGHVCYITLFGGVSWKGLSWKAWIAALVVIAALVFTLVKVIGISGVLLVPMIIYGSALLFLVFTGLCGVVRFGCKWWPILAGGIIFLTSDGLIALSTFRIESTPVVSFAVMATYILAQCLLAAGGIYLAKKSVND